MISPREPGNLPRALLLIPTTSYRTQAFVEAARRLGVQLTVSSEYASTMMRRNPSGLLALNFRDLPKALEAVAAFDKKFPISGVMGVDDQSTVLAASIADVLGLGHNPVEAVRAATNKHLMREALRLGSVRQPQFRLGNLHDDPSAIAQQVDYPCVVKPLMLAGSRGVVRANNRKEFIAAFALLKKILQGPELACEAESQHLLVEEYVPGMEVAVEGLLSAGNLQVLALFDKPDPLEGPFFEETIYVTPSRLPQEVQERIHDCVQGAVRAMGLRRGPVHAELRINDKGVFLIEIAARSIGGYCSRSLKFVRENDERTDTISLEELLLREALGMDIRQYRRERDASGVMMIPIPVGGVFEGLRGVSEARRVKCIDDIVISTHVGENLVPLPEGSKYLGFIFAHGESPELVEQALRASHRKIEILVSRPDQQIEKLSEKVYH